MKDRVGDVCQLFDVSLVTSWLVDSDPRLLKLFLLGAKAALTDDEYQQFLDATPYAKAVEAL